MGERWRYAGRNHPPYCTCVNCKGDGPRSPHNQPSNQLRAILEKWRSKNFDPHFILGIPPDSSRKLMVEAHRRWIIAYHPDRHNNDPIATELTKRVNAARDELLGKNRRGSRSQRDQQRKREEAQQRAREAERRREQKEREQQAAERRKRDEAQRRKREETERNEEWRRGSRPRTHPAQRNRASGRRTPSDWIVTSFILVSIIICYLIFTVQTPAAVDSMMEEWARLFN